jgi:hypothetical protein
MSMLVAACSGDATGSTTTNVTIPTTSAPSPAGCDQPTPLFPIEAVLEGPDGPCLEWVNKSYGRVAQGSTGSATIWSRRSESGTALVVGAVHTLGLGWLGAADTAVTESMVNPGGLTGIPRLFLIRPDGSGRDDLASPWFGFYNPSIAAERNNNLLRDVLPREDFYVAVTDSQKLDVSGLPPIVQPIRGDGVPLYDPDGVSTTDPTWAPAEAGENVLLLGYPQSTGKLTASVGRVLTDNEAQRTVTMLAELGDPEGSIAYDAAVELFIEGESAAGMSGGAVMDRDGRLVGVLVRATDMHDGVQHVRAIRMSWIVLRLAAAFDDLNPTDQQAIRDYLEPMD